jgi:hypothetical protein
MWHFPQKNNYLKAKLPYKYGSLEAHISLVVLMSARQESSRSSWIISFALYCHS